MFGFRFDPANAGTDPLLTGQRWTRSATGSVAVALVGRFHNTDVVLADLKRNGLELPVENDTELLVHAYEAWGAEVVRRLEGAFAYAIWDGVRRRVIAARDHLGLVPLYYAETGHGLAIASDAGTLRGLLPTRPVPDPMALAFVLALGYVPAPWSIWAGVRKLGAGRAVSWHGAGTVRDHRYWEPPRASGAFPVLADEWRDRFEGCLADHVRGAPPINLWLSAGLDSASIALGLRRLERPASAVTFRHPTAALDESGPATELAAHFGLPHRTLVPPVEWVDDRLKAAMRAFSEPQGHRSLLLQTLLGELVAGCVGPTIAGFGAEEVLGGHDRYQAPADEPRPSRPSARRRLRQLLGRGSVGQRARQAVQAFARRSPLHRHARAIYPVFLPSEAQALLAPTGVRFGESELLVPFEAHHEPRLPWKRSLQRIDLMSYSADCVQARLHASAIAQGIDLRCPFLDRRLAETGIANPIDPRELEVQKPLLREFLRGNAPDWVLDAPKRGFLFDPFDAVTDDAAIATIRRGFWNRDGYLAPGWEKLVQPGLPGRRSRIMSLFMLTAWAEEWCTDADPATMPDPAPDDHDRTPRGDAP